MIGVGTLRLLKSGEGRRQTRKQAEGGLAAIPQIVCNSPKEKSAKTRKIHAAVVLAQKLPGYG
jgi:hypothetical protein